MQKADALGKLRLLLGRAELLAKRGSDSPDVDSWYRDTRAAIEAIFSAGSRHSKEFGAISFLPPVVGARTSSADYEEAFQEDLGRAINLLKSQIAEIDEYGGSDTVPGGKGPAATMAPAHNVGGAQSSMNNLARRELAMPGPLAILREAIRAVPAVRYALGIAGLAAALAVIKSFSLGWPVAVVGIILMFVLMIGLVLFANFVKAQPGTFKLPVQILVWFGLLMLMAISIVIFSAIVFGTFPRLRGALGLPATGMAVPEVTPSTPANAEVVVEFPSGQYTTSTGSHGRRRSISP